MFQLDLGSTQKYCDGIIRRSFLKLGVAGMASLGLPELLKARATASGASRKTSVILMWLGGGPPHMDTYDLKPDAPVEYRGFWRPIRTRVPGFDISELFPKQALVTDKFSMVRSLHHDSGDHYGGAHRMLTAKDNGNGADQSPSGHHFPGIGAIVSHQLGARRPGIPGYVSVPVAYSVNLSPGYFGGHMLGVHHNPFQTGGDPNSPDFAVKNLNLAHGLTLGRLEERRSLTRHFDSQRRHFDSLGTAQDMDRFSQEAFEFVTGPTARRAFEINREDPRLREQYGRHGWGQSTLLARRLVEAGATFVTLHFGGWDSHWGLKVALERNMPIIDSAVSALFQDLDARGLLDTTLVVLCGELSRTPRMNQGNGGPTPGRDHWGDAMFCLLGGGGVKGGQIVGSTDRLGSLPASRPVVPSNIHATIYRVLGINPQLQLLDTSGRPVNTLDDPTPIHELF